MIEILQVIILTCKLGTGVNQNNLQEIYKAEAKCHHQLITCINEEPIWTASALVKCLSRRVK